MISISIFSFHHSFLPSFRKGKGRAKRANNPQAIQKYIDSLATHPALVGFDSPEGRRVLERFVRTSLVIIGRVGRVQKGEQILSLVPYTILTHKAGFPAYGSRQRRVDVFIYQTLRDYLNGDKYLRDFVKRVFGRGIEIGEAHELGGRYDEQTQLDVLTRLSIAFLDGFENTRPRLDREKKAPNACPALINQLAQGSRALPIRIPQSHVSPGIHV